MKIPRFWAKGTAHGKTRDGRSTEFFCWRASDVSEEEARESALAAARRVLEALLRGQKPDRYAYGCVPLREEVTNEMRDPQGNLLGVVTRNSYGSLVLNTERVMFADIDFPDVSVREAAGHFFARLFGRAKTPPEVQREEKARGDVERLMAANPAWNARVYRTLAGLRVLVTHDVFQPQSPETLDLLRQFGSDPLYVRLCKAQECFRARLTPKPWRCGFHASVFRYPLDDPRHAEPYERWKADYNSRQQNFATCRFLATLGSGTVHPDAAQVIELHDFATRANEDMALA